MGMVAFISGFLQDIINIMLPITHLILFIITPPIIMGLDIIEFIIDIIPTIDIIDIGNCRR